MYLVAIHYPSDKDIELFPPYEKTGALIDHHLSYWAWFIVTEKPYFICNYRMWYIPYNNESYLYLFTFYSQPINFPQYKRLLEHPHIKYYCGRVSIEYAVLKNEKLNNFDHKEGEFVDLPTYMGITTHFTDLRITEKVRLNLGE